MNARETGILSTRLLRPGKRGSSRGRVHSGACRRALQRSRCPVAYIFWASKPIRAGAAGGRRLHGRTARYHGQGRSTAQRRPADACASSESARPLLTNWLYARMMIPERATPAIRTNQKKIDETDLARPMAIDPSVIRRGAADHGNTQSRQIQRRLASAITDAPYSDSVVTLPLRPKKKEPTRNCQSSLCWTTSGQSRLDLSTINRAA